MPHSPEGPQRAGASWDPLACRTHWEFVDPGQAAEDIIEFDVLSGCTLLVPREVAERVGLFDDRFFAYWEDADLSLRVKRAGYRNYCSMKAIVIHKLGRSTDAGAKISCCRAYLLARGMALIARTHARGLGRLVAPLHLLEDAVRAGIRRVVRPAYRRASTAELCGLWDGWRNRPVDQHWFTS